MSNLPALYEIADQFKSLTLLAESEDLPPEVIRDTLEGLTGDMELKSANVAKFILGIEAEADMIEQAAKAMQERAAKRRKRADQIRAYLLFNLQACGITKVSCPEFTLSVRRNPPAVDIDDPEVVPAEFMATPEPPPPRPDKTKIKAALKEGRSVPGCHLRESDRLEVRV